MRSSVFSGVGNEHSAKISKMTNDDYDKLLTSLWHGVRSAGNTRTKVGQIPRLLLSVEYKTGEEFQFGRLQDYVKTVSSNGKAEKAWDSTEDYKLDLSKIIERLEGQKDRIEKIRYDASPDVVFAQDLPASWENLKIEDRKI